MLIIVAYSGIVRDEKHFVVRSVEEIYDEMIKTSERLDEVIEIGMIVNQHNLIDVMKREYNGIKYYDYNCYQDISISRARKDS